MAGTFLGSGQASLNKTISGLFLHGGDKFTRQLSEICHVLVIGAYGKNEWRRKIGNNRGSDIRFL